MVFYTCGELVLRGVGDILRNGQKEAANGGVLYKKVQKVGCLMEVSHVAKTKTIRRWELNTSDNFMNLRAENFFVGRCRSNIYTM